MSTLSLHLAKLSVGSSWNEDLKARLDQSFERATRKYLEAENEVRKIHHQILVMRKMKNVDVADVGIDHLEVRVVVDQKIEGNVKEKMMKVSLDLCCERW